MRWSAGCRRRWRQFCPSLDAAHQGNFPFDYVKGLYELLGELRGQNPGLAIQACASGGGRADYGLLRYADEPSGLAVHSDAVGKTVSGAALMTLGVPFFLTGDYDSLVLVLQ